MAWSRDDRDKAIAYRLRKKAECPHCGTRAEEWDESRGGDVWAYVADERHCRGCEQVQAKRASLPPDRRGMHVILRRRRDGGG